MNRTNRLILAGIVAAIAIGGALGAFAATRTVETTANVEVRVWRRISDGELFLSTRPTGGDWKTSAPLNMAALSNSGQFQLSSVITVDVPVSVVVEVPDGTGAAPTRVPPPAARPDDSETPVAGPCCDVLGMQDVTGLQDQVEREMQRVIDFALDEYGITHTGNITLHIAHSQSGLGLRYQEVFGRESDEVPDTCAYQEGEHMFIGPSCRSDRVELASVWFDRAVGTGEVTPTWIGHGVRDYFANHYATGEVPVVTEDRFRRAIFYERSRHIRQDRASDDMKTLVMLYALDDYGEFADWLRFYGGTVSGLDADVAFQSVFNATLAEFYNDFEEWADHQQIILFSTAFSSCLEASRSIRAQADPAGLSSGFPDYRVPLEPDPDEDGIVCEGYQPPEDQ
ncbi:MAG: hypothetical protein OXI51_14190 [Chloroflexota bacterium]|nr:hypothetical protein [Chloroflexota bacterium]